MPLKSKSAKITRTIRLSPDISERLDQEGWGDVSATIEKALRRLYKMPARDAGEK